MQGIPLVPTTASHDQIACCCICCGNQSLAKSPAVLMPFVAYRVFGHEPCDILPEWGLRDLRPGTAYTLCNSLQCRECGLLFLDYRFTDTQMAALYAGYRDARYTRERDRFEPGYAATAALGFEKRSAYIADVERWLAPHLPERPAVLDWGGGNGLNSPFLGRADILHVLDISAVACVEGAESARPEKFGRQHYDLLACSEVLEHVPYPLELLNAMLPAAGKETLLYLEVPHEALMREFPDNRELVSRKRHWHEHINFFNLDALVCLLERVGLRYIDHKIFSNDAKEFMGVIARRR
ncbi:MAG TPA: class I SAM-dependent methyltransferase [Rhodocyclaceae bacterium]|nr:class I SAM-dependent methyltransferase [Rhodocyclaceae bacterium]